MEKNRGGNYEKPLKLNVFAFNGIGDVQWWRKYLRKKFLKFWSLKFEKLLFSLNF